MPPELTIAYFGFFGAYIAGLAGWALYRWRV